MTRSDAATIVWFRQDLRLADNPALAKAATRGRVLPVFVLDETTAPAGRPIGGASRWWLHHSLASLARDLGGLVLLRGDPLVLIPALARETGATGVFWNRCYEPFAVARDTKLKAGLTASDLDVASFNSSLLFEPWQVETASGAAFKVYSPFWRACRKLSVEPASERPQLKLAKIDDVGDKLSDWQLLPKRPNWATGFEKEWAPGESGAHARLVEFLTSGLTGYAHLRNRPDHDNVSRLSPHLHFGEVSPRQVWAATLLHVEATGGARTDADKFLAELGWREFAYHLLYYFPNLPTHNLKSPFDAYPWVNNPSDLRAWQHGMTGYPIVDAGMRQLWTTGYMHNRVRMVVASFLTKHLRIDWRLGESWFWDTLVDADLANNAASWQWVAGSGADAAPYYRVFNPVTQGHKFDPDGVYVRRWCPELALLPNEVLHAPFEATAGVLRAAGVTLGKTYPLPIVEHTQARAAALAGYNSIMGERGSANRDA